MIELIHDFTHPIFAEKEGPMVSLYQNTHKNPTSAQHDILAFKNHLKTIETRLRKNYDETRNEQLLEPLHKLLENKTFWHDNKQAILLFASVNNVVVMRLNKPVKETITVADSLHTKPLLRHFQTHQTFHVLTLNRDTYSLYTCTQDDCQKVVFKADALQTREDVLGTLEEEKYLSHASYGGAGNHAMYHGHDDTKDMIKKDTERFFRYIDDYILNEYSRHTKRPLILWCLPEHQSLYRKLSKNPHLLEEGIKQSDKGLNESTVQNKAWEIIAPYYHQELEKMLRKYHHATANNLASDHLSDIAQKAVQGNVALAFISADQTRPGKLNVDDGTLAYDLLEDEKNEDILDDLTDVILKHGGTVYVLGDEEMPTEQGVAAIYRY